MTTLVELSAAVKDATEKVARCAQQVGHAGGLREAAIEDIENATQNLARASADLREAEIAGRAARDELNKLLGIEDVPF